MEHRALPNPQRGVFLIGSLSEDSAVIPSRARMVAEANTGGS